MDLLYMSESPENSEKSSPPRKAGIIILRVSLLAQERRHEEALLAFSEALSFDPNRVLAWVGKGFTLGKLGRYEEEIECCEKAISLDPNCVDAWNFKGFALGCSTGLRTKWNLVSGH